MTDSGINKIMLAVLSIMVLSALVFIYFLPEEKQDGDGHYKEDKKQIQGKQKSK